MTNSQLKQQNERYRLLIKDLQRQLREVRSRNSKLESKIEELEKSDGGGKNG